MPATIRHVRHAATLLISAILIAGCGGPPDNAAAGAKLDPLVAAVIGCHTNDQTIVRGSLDAAWGRDEDVIEMVRLIAVDDTDGGFQSQCNAVIGFSNAFSGLDADCEAGDRNDALAIIKLRLLGLKTEVIDAVIDEICPG